MLSRALDRVRRVWRDKVASPTLQTYDAACDELGGAPWRPVPEATDRWFLADRPKSGVGASAPPLPMLDTGSVILRRHMSDATKLALLAGTALLAIVGVVIALAGGGTRNHAPWVQPATVVTSPSNLSAPGVTPHAASVAPTAVSGALPATRPAPPAAGAPAPAAATSSAGAVPHATLAPAPRSAHAVLFAKRQLAHRRRR